MAGDTDLLTHVGPGTPMGELMRQYWVPSARADELVAGGAPVRLMLLGEKLLGFRSPDGTVGVMDHRCPHRCASLFFGRNEEGGIRCAYHGWKFAPDGACLDMPNVPKHQAFIDRVRAKAYPAVEQNGLIWVYMGKAEQPPALPLFEVTMLPEEVVHINTVQRECNWLQALEGDIDTSHFGFLHAGHVDEDDLDPEHPSRFALINRAPEYMVADTDWGTMYAAHRGAYEGETYWRFAHYLFPFWSMSPEGVFGDHVMVRAWVPMDDTHSMLFHLSWKRNTPPMMHLKDGRNYAGGEIGFLPNTTEWFGRWRLEANSSNDYLMERGLQGPDSYSGIRGIFNQDTAVTESMGPITDHGFENLAISDRMITRTRRRIATAVRDLEAGGILPPGIERPEVYQGARSGGFVTPTGIGWLQAYADEIRGSLNPASVLRIAAE